MKSDITVVPVIENSIYIEHYFFVNTTPSFMQDLTNRLIPLERFVHDVQNLKYMWLKPLKNSNYYEILLPESIVLCSLGKQSIELNGFYEKSIRNHAQFFKDGMSIRFNKEVIVLNQNVLLNKQAAKNCRQEEHYMEKTISHIVDTLNYIHNRKQAIEADVNHRIYEIEFENWLGAYDQSTIYQLESNIVGQPQIKYKKIALDDVFEPFTLSFYIDSILPLPLNYRYTYYIKSVKNEWISAFLHERYTDGKMTVIVLKFNRLFTVNDFNPEGHIFLLLDSSMHNNRSNHIYYSQLQAKNVLKALLTNQLSISSEETNQIMLNPPAAFNLDEEQQKAVQEALQAKQLYYIDGAVTTGKTQMLNCIKAYYEAEKKSVLHITTHDQNQSDEYFLNPTHLEKKIEALKISILNAIDKFEALIISDKKLITSYSSDSLDLEVLEGEYGNLNEYLKKYYIKMKQNYIQPLKSLLEQFNANEELLSSIYKKITLEEKKLNQQMEKSEFSRWLTLPVLINLQAKIKKNYASFLTVSERQKRIAKAYNENSIKLKDVLADEQFKIKKEMWQTQRNKIHKLKEKLAGPFSLDSIRSHTFTNKSKQAKLNKDGFFMLTNQLERLHIALRQYRQAITYKYDDLFFSYFIKERQSTQISMQKLHQHFSLFINEYDIVIIDDAQTYTPMELFLAISLGKKAVVAGDKQRICLNTIHKPYLNDMINSSPSLYKKSGAQVLAKLLPTSLQGELTNLYRVIPSLTCIYNNKLFSEVSKIRNKTEISNINMLQSITNPVLLLTTSQTKDHYESAVTGHDIYNHCEAITIVDLIVSMLEMDGNEKIKLEDILVTSFFDTQIEYIRSHLRYALPSLSADAIHSIVRPIISCTGLEKKIVLVSMCVSNKESTTNRDLTQLRHSHLWNIVLSRGKHQLILVGDVDYIKGTISNERGQVQNLEMDYDWSSYDVANLMRSFIKLALDGELQFVSLANFPKLSEQISGGFGYEQSNYK